MEKLMSLRRSMSQLRPARTQKVDLQERVQSLLTEATMTARDFFTKDATRDNQKLFVKKAIAGELIGTDGKKFKKIPANDKELVAFSKLKVNVKPDTAKDKKVLKDLIDTHFGKMGNIEKGANGFSGGKTGGGSSKAPSGAEWENIIVHQYNKLLGKEDFDNSAKEAAEKFYPTYEEIGKKIATNFKGKKIKSQMIQFGGGKSKGNLSSFWISKGGVDGTPKTDMYSNDYNISLKKKGGSQLASGAKGETLAMYSAALEYLGADKSGLTQIKKIQKEIEDNFTKISTDYTKGDLENMSKASKKNLSAKDKKDVAQFITTEKFHKELNEKIKEHLNFEKNPEFVKFLIYEAMSGSKKFSLQKARASVCVEFDADNGNVSKFIPITKNGKNKFDTEVPSISSEVEAYASKVKIYSAWKSGKGNPYSSLRISSRFGEKEETLQSIVKEVIRKDIITNAVLKELKEEVEQLDEFAIVNKVFNKLKDVGRNAINWIKNLIKKIINAVKNALDKIAKLGKKMFEGLFRFIGMELDSKTKITYPSEINGFVHGMGD
tara:strand:+ start:31 stop:1677 length:1647 start_codon:yes stop_codon:yes gene_type:complete